MFFITKSMGIKSIFGTSIFVLFVCFFKSNHIDWYDTRYDSFLKKHHLQKLSYEGKNAKVLKFRFFKPSVLRQRHVPASYKKEEGTNKLILVSTEYWAMDDELWELTQDLRTKKWTALYYSADSARLPTILKPKSGWVAFEKKFKSLSVLNIPEKINVSDRWLVLAPDCGGARLCEWSDNRDFFYKVFYSNECMELRDSLRRAPTAAQLDLQKKMTAFIDFIEYEF